MRDTLAPDSSVKRLTNFLLNSLWSIAWLLRSLYRGLRRCLFRKE